MTAKRLLVAIALLAGLAVRVPGLFSPPLDFHPTRQYRSAILARALVLDRLPLADAEKAAARGFAAALPTIEPPIIEHAAALVYRVAGRESLVLPRAFGGLIRIMGGAVLYWLMTSLWPEALAPFVGIVLYLFLPFGIPASVAFQPDGLMTVLTVATVAAAVQWEKRPGFVSLITLVLAGAAAMLVKPMAAFFLCPVIGATFIRRWALWRGLGYTVTVITVISAPAALWYVAMAPDVGGGRILPGLISSATFWARWAHMMDLVVPLPVVVIALAGVAMSTGLTRTLLLALWGGYAAMGLVLTYHIHTHTYDSLPLIPIVALSASALVAFVERHLVPAPRLSVPTAALVLTCGLAATAPSVTLNILQRPKMEQTVADYRHIGNIVGHGSRVAAIDDAYAYPLNYYGFLSADSLPIAATRTYDKLKSRPVDNTVARLEALQAEFLVVTMPEEIQADEALRQLVDRSAIVDRGGIRAPWRYEVFKVK